MGRVLPYEEIFPKELYKDLLKSFLSLLGPDSKLKTVDSKIITYQHVELISKWIDKLVIADNVKNSYEFKLLFRGSRDGLSSDRFHEICDNKSRTVTIVKIEGSSEILGGYNPIEWKSDYIRGVTKDSFIFSFKSKESIGNYILSRVIDEKVAVRNGCFNGPSFGDGDLIMWGLSLNGIFSRCHKGSYEKPIRETGDTFSVEECEVFQVV